MPRRTPPRSTRSGHSLPSRPRPADPTTLERLETRLALAVDLVGTLNYSDGVRVPGDSFNVPVSVDNLGDEDAGQHAGFLVLTRNTILGDSDDVLVGNYFTNSIGALTTFSANIPANLDPGLWFMGLIVDAAQTVAESDENNNNDVTTDTIVRNASDLQAAVSLSQPSPLPVPGDTIEVTFAFVNNSDFAAGPHTSRVLLSPDGSFGGPDDIVLFEREFTGIDPFDTRAFVEDLLIPADLAPGNWRLGVVADVNDEVVELDETNNRDATSFDLVIVTESRPDLVPEADFTSINIPTIPGSNLPVEFAVSNLSDFAVEATTARVVLSLDDVLGNGDDVLLEDVDINALGASATQLVRPVVAIPDNLAAGEWYLGIITDATQIIDELDETNNTLLSPDPAVTVFPPSDVNIVIFGGGLGSQTIQHETKAQRSKGTGFGPVEVDSGSKAATFVIFNGGNDQLLISAIEIRGQRPGDFAITVLPEFTVAGGSTQSFTVTFDPTDFGTRRANVAIFSSDPDRPRFTMRIAGRGVPDPALQDIAVTGGTDTISDGDRKARNGTGQKFGTAAVGQPIDRIFTITNEGDSILSFLSPVIRVAGTNPDDFSVLALPVASTLAPGATTTFTIRFSPLAIGLRKATIEVISDDPDEGTFDFRVSALGI